VRADEVGGGGAGLVELDGRLFVGVGVELDASLLGEDGGIALGRTEGDAGEVAVHGWRFPVR
jgi:hypothetical protein